MPRIGLHASHEQIPPSRLLAAVRHAEAAGFDAAMCSDHFSPWSERQGESGFAWSWLGAALEATELSLGCVNAPGQRYHPAIIAQAAATLAEMYPGRFWVALGTGEASNEHITGEPWPDKATRNARLRECVDVMRALFAGEVVDHDGLVTVDRARLWTLPEQPPKLIGAAVSAETAGWVGEWADGLVTINQPRETLERVLGRLPRRRRRGQAGLPPGPPVVGARRAARRSTSPTTSGAPTSSSRRSRGTCTPSRRSTRPRASCGPRTCAAGCSSRPTSSSTLAWLQELARARLRRDLPPPRRPGARAVHRRLRGARAPGAAMKSQGHQRPLVEERRPLLPRRRDVPGLRRRRLRRPRRA